MKIAFKILLIIILLLTAFVITAPFLFKNKIFNLVKEQANKNVNAVVNFNNNISIGMLKSFPNLSVTINNITVAGINQFKGDTLLSLKTFNATLDLMSVIKGGAIKILKINLTEPNINAIVLKNGMANWDIAKTSTNNTAENANDTASTFNVKLTLLQVTNGNIIYNDRQGNIYARLDNVNYTLKGDFSQSLFKMENTASVEKLSYAMGGIPYLNNCKLIAEALIDADMPNMKFTFNNNKIALNNLSLSFNGNFSMPNNDMLIDINFKADESNFINFLSLIPAVYKQDISKLNASGKLGFNGFVKGKYNQATLPGIGLNIMVNNGNFKHADMPVLLEKVNVNLNVSKPQGNLDLLTINLSNLDFSIKNNPFLIKMYASNLLSDPNIDVNASGKIFLDHIAGIVPLPDKTVLKGLIDLNTKFAGRVSALEKQQFQNFNANGFIKIKDLYYASADLPKPFLITDANMNISAKAFMLSAFNAQTGSSDFNLKGIITNFIPYYFNKGIVAANFTLVSNQLNANEFLTNASNASSAAADTAALTVFKVPENINITFNSSVNKLQYTNIQINNFAGTVTVKNNQINFNNIALNTLGSTIKMNGFYNTEETKVPKVDINFKLNNLDIQKAFATFNTIKKIAPAAEKISGTFNADFNFKSQLLQNMQPNLQTIMANGYLNIPSAIIQNIHVIDNIADVLQKPELKNGTITNANIKFTIENGNITTQPFEVNLGAQKFMLSGITGLNQSINYLGQTSISRKELAVIGSITDKALANLNSTLGSNINLSEIIPIDITISGTFTRPVIKTNLGKTAKNKANDIASQLTDIANKKKAEAKAKVKAEAEKLKQEAELKAQKLKSDAEKAKKDAEAKARAEADRLKKEAEAKANAEKERLKKKAEEEAKKRIKGIF